MERTAAAIVLAAGAGKRFGGGKMEAPFRGRPLIDHAIAIAAAAPVSQILVVTTPKIARYLHGACDAFRSAANARSVEVESLSLADSLRAGIAALSHGGPCEHGRGARDGAFVFLGDMPLVPPDIAERLLEKVTASVRRGEPVYAALAQFEGTPGHPVWLSDAALDEAARLDGDSGAGRLLRGRGDVIRLDCTDAGVCADIDLRADIARLETRG